MKMQVSASSTLVVHTLPSLIFKFQIHHIFSCKLMQLKSHVTHICQNVTQNHVKISKENIFQAHSISNDILSLEPKTCNVRTLLAWILFLRKKSSSCGYRLAHHLKFYRVVLVGTDSCLPSAHPKWLTCSFIEICRWRISKTG